LEKLSNEEISLSGTICYRIEARESNENPYGIKGLSQSNTYCFQKEPVENIPNAFHPYSLIPENRIFAPQIQFATDYYLVIYTRWGNKVFETNNIQIGWDGRNKNGDLFPQGAYAFALKYKKPNSFLVEKTGLVYLVY